MIGLERGNQLKGQQRNTLRRSIRLSYFSSHSSVSTGAREVKHTGLFRWFNSSDLRGTACLPFHGSCRSSSSLSCGKQASKGVLSSNTVAICMVIYTVTLCPLVTLKKLSQKSKESSSNVYSLLDTLWFHPTSRQTEGRGQSVWVLLWLAFFDILQWRGWKKEGVKSSFGCIVRKPNIGNYLWFARS